MRLPLGCSSVEEGVASKVGKVSKGLFGTDMWA